MRIFDLPGIKVRNMKNTTDHERSCPCASWMEHWERHTQRKAKTCSVYKCHDSAAHGAHVQKMDGEKTWYIVPFCVKHNHPSEEDREKGVFLKDDAPLALVKEQESCKKKEEEWP